jgi:hypothetical protein
MLLTHSPLLGIFALGAAAIDLNVGRGDRTIQNLKQKVSDHESKVQSRSDTKLTTLESESISSSLVKREDVDLSELYPAHNLSVPVDYFHNESCYEPHSNEFFNLRYWFDASNYKPGGPVIVLQSGETSGVGRLPFLQKGIVAQLTQATNGIGVILEHRYYGTSFPTPNISTENLRFLTTEQALADQAYFSQHIKFPGMEDQDLSSNTTAHIAYGGSYAGAYVAFLRKIYPDVYWGAISSSGVTKAIYDYWQYYAAIAKYGPKDCIKAQKTLTHMVDNILIGKNDTDLTMELKDAFGLGNITYDNDFASVLGSGVGNFQSLNWDPEISSPEFYNYCNNISSTDVLYPATEAKRKTASHLLKAGGYKPKEALVNQLLNYIGYINSTSVSRCDDYNQDSCYSQHNATFYEDVSISSYGTRSWAYQYCTEWGYLQTGSGVPKNELPLISRTIDLEYSTLICRYAFNRTAPPDVERVNKYGGYDISYPRLAFLDGQWDPWRPASPHAFDYGARRRKSTISEPFILIDDAVHHWDENGLFPNETTSKLPPKPVVDAQREEVKFVKAWMHEWKYKRAEEGKWWY